MENIRDFIKHNVLTTVEVAEILQVSRTRVPGYVQEGKLPAIRKTSNGLLFLRADVEAFKRRQELDYTINSKKDNIIFDESGSTHKSIEFFKANVSKLDEIISIFIYFEEIDAALDNFYKTNGATYGEIYKITTPHLIIRDINGKELWLSGCNCGYRGIGPGGTQKVLRALGFEGDIVEKYIFDYKVVKLFKNINEEWEFVFHNGIFEEESYDSYKEFKAASAQLYEFKNNLVLLQDDYYVFETQPLKVLQKYRSFIPNPKEVLIFTTREQAEKFGYIAPISRYGISDYDYYNFIIVDNSGRQLWLKPDIFDDKPLVMQNNVLDILKMCGFSLPEQKLSDKIKKWLDTNIRKIPIQPIRLKK